MGVRTMEKSRLAITSLIRLTRVGGRATTLEMLLSSCKTQEEKDFVAQFSTLEGACEELKRLVDAQGGFEALEGLEKNMDFNESLYGWDD